MSEQQKYRVVYDPYKKGETYENQLNALADAGYKVKSVQPDFILMEYDGKGEVEAVKDVSHGEVEALVKRGWKVESIYSKQTILVRRA